MTRITLYTHTTSHPASFTGSQAVLHHFWMPLKVAANGVAFLQTHYIPTHSFKDTRVQGPAETYELVLCSENPRCWVRQRWTQNAWMWVNTEATWWRWRSQKVEGGWVPRSLLGGDTLFGILYKQEINIYCFWVITHIWVGVLPQLKVCDTLPIRFINIKSQ